jgi:hypothetical protein
LGKHSVRRSCFEIVSRAPVAYFWATCTLD